MLEKRVYSRSDLIELFKTERLDAIKKKISRSGYVYREAGRGSSYTLEIIDLPFANQFKNYCIEELGFSPQTDFNKLKYFLFYFLENEEFMTLQYNEMASVLLDHGISITPQTISNYFQHLESIGWIYSDRQDYVYYLYDQEQQQNKYISKEEYCAINREYWDLVKNKNFSFSDAAAVITGKYGNKPKKRPLKLKTAFMLTQYQAVWDLIENEIMETKKEG